MDIASLEAHSTLNTYNLWKLVLRGHLNTDARKRGRTRSFWITRSQNNEATALQMLPRIGNSEKFILELTLEGNSKSPTPSILKFTGG